MGLCKTPTWCQVMEVANGGMCSRLKFSLLYSMDGATVSFNPSPSISHSSCDISKGNSQFSRQWEVFIKQSVFDVMRVLILQISTFVVKQGQLCLKDDSVPKSQHFLLFLCPVLTVPNVVWDRWGWGLKFVKHTSQGNIIMLVLLEWVIQNCNGPLNGGGSNLKSCDYSFYLCCPRMVD